MLKEKDAKRKEAQGRKSLRKKKENETKILVSLAKKPITFKKLHETVGFSKPVLSNHLKNLRKRGLIEKAIEDEKIVYRIISKEKVLKEVKTDINDFVSYLMSSETEIMGTIADRVWNKLMEQTAESEPYILVPESKINELITKYPDAMKELLEAAE